MTIPWKAREPRFAEVSVEKDVPVPMRDGTVLYADVYRPVGLKLAPVLLVRTPYNKVNAQTGVYAHPIWYARFGYIVVVQDTRGRWKSEGEWYPFRHEADDGRDTLDWLKTLPGSNGLIATYGFSYCGTTQLMAAIGAGTSVAAMVPAMTGSDFYEGWTYRGGALQLAFARNWAWFLGREAVRRQRNSVKEEQLTETLLNAQTQYWTHMPPSLDAEGPAHYYYDWITHDIDDDYWKRWSIKTRYSQISAPALHIGGWYDIFVDGVIDNFNGLRQLSANEHSRQNQKLVIGPWHHVPWKQCIGAVDFGDDARNAIDSLQVLWFDKFLQGQSNEIDTEPAVSYFLMGRNEWRSSSHWPPVEAKATDFFLHSKGKANSRNGWGSLDSAPPTEELPDIWVYDPDDPVMSLGGRSCCDESSAPMGPADQALAEYRNDVLVYTTAPLTSDLEVAGLVKATLYLASDAVDTDFSVRLVDVHPCGKALNVVEGHLRARFRKSLSKPELLDPNAIYEYGITLGNTAMVFLSGHRVRLDITSSNFPAMDRNSNSGKPLAQTQLSDIRVSCQTLFHDSGRPSRLTLPIMSGN